MVEPLRHRQTKGAGTDMCYLKPPRHISTPPCVTTVCMTARNCTRDEGRPFEVGNQVLTSSHRKLLSSKAMVVNVAETPGQDSGKARLREASASIRR
jgi:hypothetical protein